jgi:hypothetical protein
MILFAKPNSAGVAQLTVTAVAQSQSASAQFQLTVIGPNTAPAILNLADSASVTIGQTRSFPFAVADSETPTAALDVQATPLGTGPLASAQITGDAANRVLLVTADSKMTGNQSVAVTVRDADGVTTQQLITLAVVGPQLQVARQGTQLVLSSSDAPDGGEIEFRTGFDAGQTWQTLGPAPAAVRGLRIVKMPTPAGPVFFRWKF